MNGEILGQRATTNDKGAPSWLGLMVAQDSLEFRA